MALTSRENDHTGFTNKGAQLTNDEIDQNWFDLYDLIESAQDAVGNIHTQNTDTYLDQGGSDEVSASDLAALVYEADNNPLHTQGTDQGLDTGGANAVTAEQLRAMVDTQNAIQILSSDGNSDGSRTILPDTSSAGKTLTMRTVDIDRGGEYYVFDYLGNGAANNITIQTEGTETIDGGNSITIAVNRGYARLAVVGGNLVTLDRLLT